MENFAISSGIAAWKKASKKDCRNGPGNRGLNGFNKKDIDSDMITLQQPPKSVFINN
jgi:hypothetical protein